MSGAGVKGAGVVVCHEIPEIKVLVHALDMEEVDVLRTSRAGGCQVEFAPRVLVGVGSSVKLLKCTCFNH